MINSIRRFFAPPIFPDDQDKTQAAQVLNTLLLSSMGVLMLGGVATALIFVEKLYNLIFGLMFFSILAGTHWMMRRGRVRLASATFVSGIWVVFTIFMSLAGGITSILAIFYVGGTVITGLLLGERAARIYAASCILAGLGMVIAEANGFLPPRVFPVPARAAWLDVVLCLLLTLTALNLTLRGLREALARARHNERALEASNRKLEAEIAERRRVDEALRESEERYRTLFEHANDAVFLMDKDDEIIDVNRRACEMFGYSRKNLLRMKASDLQAPEVRGEKGQVLRQALEQYNGLFFEALNLHRDGTRIPVEVSLSQRPGQETELVLAIVRDVTERKKAEGALLESEERYRRLVELSPDLIAIHRNGDFLYINKAGVDLLGASGPDQIIGKSVTEFVVPAQRDTSIERMRRLLKEGQRSPIYEQTIIRPDGTERDLEVVGIPFAYQGGMAVQIIAHDITERKEAEKALRESERRFRRIIRFSPIGVGIVDSKGDLTDCNAALAEMVGYSREELLCMNFADLTHPDDLEREWRLIDELWGARTTEYRMEKRYIHKDGHIIWVDVAAALYKGETEELAFGFAFVQDITERKRAEEQIQASLREKEVLLREIHHRVKNNLTVISSLLDFQSASIEDDELRAAFENSQHRIRSMARVHEHLYRSHSLARVDMAEYIQSLGDYLYQSYGAYTLDFKVDVPHVAFGIDTAVPCGLILNELISNALKHAFPEGQGGEIQVALHTIGTRCELIVRDDGGGLPEDLDLKDINSLGLRLVSLLTRQLQGALEVERKDGTVFRITFEAPELEG